MNAEKPYDGPTITHQAFEYLPHTWQKLQTMKRCWSRWTDGKVTHSDLRPPPGLNWIDTTKILTAKVL